MTQKKDKTPLLKRLLKVVTVALVVLILGIAGALEYVNVKKNEIGNSLIQQVNTLLIGEINVGDIEIESLWTYPNINVKLKNTQVYEQGLAVRDSGVSPVILAPEILVRVNLKTLFTNTLTIEFVQIENARVVIDRKEDASVTIGTTFSLAKRDTVPKDSVDFVLQIDSILLENTQVLLVDRALQDTLPIRLKDLTGHLRYAENKVTGFAQAKGKIEKLEVSKSLSYTNSPLSFAANYEVRIKKRTVTVTSKKVQLANTPFKFDFLYDYSSPSHFNLKLNSLEEGLEIGSVFNPQNEPISDSVVHLKGIAHANIELNWSSNSKRSYLNNLNAELDISAQNLKIMGIDLEGYIEKYIRSQNFNLVDVGAVMLAGPVGLAVTKGSDYTLLLIKSKGDDSTLVKQFVSEWSLNNGKLQIEDLAMSTERSRLASLGNYNINKDSLDFRLLIVDKHGCALADQSLYGTSDNIESGKVKIVKTLVGPFTNFFRNVGLADCKMLYDGKVAYPEIPKTKDN